MCREGSSHAEVDGAEVDGVDIATAVVAIAEPAVSIGSEAAAAEVLAGERSLHEHSASPAHPRTSHWHPDDREPRHLLSSNDAAGPHLGHDAPSDGPGDDAERIFQFGDMLDNPEVCAKYEPRMYPNLCPITDTTLFT